MNDDRHAPISLRRLILTRVSALVAATTLLVTAGFVWFGLLPMAEQIAHNQFDAATTRVKTDLNVLFASPASLLDMSHGWLAGQAPDLNSPEAFNHLFQPVLESSPQITSVVAGTSSGQGWLLLQQADGSWRNRITDVARWGNEHHRLIDRWPDGRSTSRWDGQRYDARQRQWYQAAQAGTSEQNLYWTEPYTFFTTGEPGITASTSMRLRDGRDFVLGFDLKLRDLSRSTGQASVSNHGLALVVTQDERVLALPARPTSVTQAEWDKRILKPVAEIGLLPVTDAFAGWHRGARKTDDILNYKSGGMRWLAHVRPYPLGNQQFWVVTLAPASDFTPAWLPIILVLTAALALVLVLAVFLTRLAAARLTHPLETLARVTQQIGLLDFQTRVPLHSSIIEIKQLASAQNTMLGLLQDNQKTLAEQAKALRDQIATLLSTKAEVNRQNDMLAAIIENFPGGVSVCDATLHLVAYNDQFKTLLDLPASLFQKPTLFFEDFIRHNARRGDYGPGDPEQLVSTLVARAREFKAHKTQRVLADGTALEIRGMPLPAGGFVTLYIDVTEREAHQQRLEYLAHFDDLTALPNRVLLADRLHQAMVQAQRHSQKLAVVYLDLDSFKIINDKHGHEIGDQLLTALAAGMKQALREGDTLARIGGDEFVAVLLDLPNNQACVPMLTRLLNAAAEPTQIGALLLQVSASLGVTFYPQAEEVDADLLLRQADQAMYQAKQSGKNRYHFFDAELDRSARSQYENVEHIRQALTKDEFVLYYQPKVNMRSGVVVGAEALIRWQHPQQGLLLPAHFLPVVEDHPLAIDIGEWVIASALSQIERWHADGLDIPISVNVGARQLLQANFVARLQELLAAHPQVNPSRLEIEVLETSALEDLSHVSKVIEDCRALGVNFALDDFGTGYSSLTYLKQLQVTLLKIDKSFVRDMLSNPNDLVILQGVIGLASSFKREVIAEGVESIAIGTLLLQMGCELGQGYAIARPMPAADLPGWTIAWQLDPPWGKRTD